MKKASLGPSQSIGYGFVGYDDDGNIGAYLPNALQARGVAPIGIAGRRLAVGRRFVRCRITIEVVQDTKKRSVVRIARAVDNRPKNLIKDIPGQALMLTKEGA